MRSLIPLIDKAIEIHTRAKTPGDTVQKLCIAKNILMSSVNSTGYKFNLQQLTTFEHQVRSYLTQLAVSPALASFPMGLPVPSSSSPTITSVASTAPIQSSSILSPSVSSVSSVPHRPSMTVIRPVPLMTTPSSFPSSSSSLPASSVPLGRPLMVRPVRSALQPAMQTPPSSSHAMEGSGTKRRVSSINSTAVLPTTKIPRLGVHDDRINISNSNAVTTAMATSTPTATSATLTSSLGVTTSSTMTALNAMATSANGSINVALDPTKYFLQQVEALQQAVPDVSLAQSVYVCVFRPLMATRMPFSDGLERS